MTTTCQLVSESGTFPARNAATNIIPFGILIGGEELHNNHHTFATSAKLSSKWYEFDIGYFYIRVLETFGLAKVKKLAPKMEELKQKYGKDPAKQQQELIALYQREGANPVAGCLPILLQIPVFYALYKVLFVTLEMRHAPFFGWVNDLSARERL